MVQTVGIFCKCNFLNYFFICKENKLNSSEWDTKLERGVLKIKTSKLTKYRKWLPMLVCLLILMHITRWVTLNNMHTSFIEELKTQLLIIVLFKKWMPYNMLMFCDEKWDCPKLW